MADGFQRQSDALIKWFLNDPHAAMNSKVKVADLRSAGRGRGIVAIADLIEGEEVFRIPISKTLSTETSGLTNVLRGKTEGIEEWAVQVLVLVYEHLRGSYSAWEPYLSLLPRTLDTPVFWTGDELQQLQGCAVKDRIRKDEADSVFQEKLVPLIMSNAAVFFSGSAKPLNQQDLFQLAHHMASMVLAYGFDIEKPEKLIATDENGYANEADLLMRAMVPMADMLNAEADNNTQLFHDDPNYLSLSTIKAIKAGEELLNDYGQLPRSEVLRRYGYIHDSYRQFDSIELSQSALTKSFQKQLSISDQKLHKILRMIEDRNELEDEYLVTASMATGRCLPEDLISFVKALIRNANEQKLLTSSKEADEQAHLELCVGKVLQQALEDKLGEYQTTLAEDAVILRQNRATPRVMLAVEIRHGEKQIISEALIECIQMQNIDASTSDIEDYMLCSKRQKIR